MKLQGRLTIALALAALLAFFMATPSFAQDAPLEGRYEFTGKSTDRYFEMSDSNGTLTATLTYKFHFRIADGLPYEA